MKYPEISLESLNDKVMNALIELTNIILSKESIMSE